MTEKARSEKNLHGRQLSPTDALDRILKSKLTQKAYRYASMTGLTKRGFNYMCKNDVVKTLYHVDAFYYRFAYKGRNVITEMHGMVNTKDGVKEIQLKYTYPSPAKAFNLCFEAYLIARNSLMNGK